MRWACQNLISHHHHQQGTRWLAGGQDRIEDDTVERDDSQLEYCGKDIEGVSMSQTSVADSSLSLSSTRIELVLSFSIFASLLHYFRYRTFKMIPVDYVCWIMIIIWHFHENSNVQALVDIQFWADRIATEFGTVKILVLSLIWTTAKLGAQLFHRSRHQTSAGPYYDSYSLLSDGPVYRWFDIRDIDDITTWNAGWTNLIRTRHETAERIAQRSCSYYQHNGTNWRISLDLKSYKFKVIVTPPRIFLMKILWKIATLQNVRILIGRRQLRMKCKYYFISIHNN